MGLSVQDHKMNGQKATNFKLRCAWIIKLWKLGKLLESQQWIMMKIIKKCQFSELVSGVMLRG